MYQGRGRLAPSRRRRMTGSRLERLEAAMTAPVPELANASRPSVPAGGGLIRPTYDHGQSVQADFEDAVAKLWATDSRLNPRTGQRELNADLVLEGGGVKAIGLAGAICVLAEAGHHFPRPADTSAGAIAAVLAAAVEKSSSRGRGHAGAVVAINRKLRLRTYTNEN